MTAALRFRPRALLLDMDGLMVDSEPLWFKVEREFARSRGAEWTEQDARLAVGGGIASTLKTMEQTFGFEVDPVADADAIFDAFIAQVAVVTLKPGCLELLDAARGKAKLCVASSSPMRLIRAVLDHFELIPRFDALVSGESVPHPKPAPDIFLRASETLGQAPSECLVLEDSMAGVRAAHAAKIEVIAVPEGSPAGRGFEAVASAIARDLWEARAMIAFD